MATKILIIFFITITVLLSVTLSRKVIFVNFAENHKKFRSAIHDTKLLSSGIIVVPPEKIDCKDQRIVDRYNKCRKIIEF